MLGAVGCGFDQVKTSPLPLTCYIAVNLYPKFARNMQYWYCWGLRGSNPQFMSTDAHFWVQPAVFSITQLTHSTAFCLQSLHG